MSRIRPYIVFVSLLASFGGFVWGFDAAVISGVAPFLKQYFVFNGTQGDLELGLAVSALAWGVLAGMAVSRFLSRRFGGRRILIVTAAVFALAALMSARAASFPVFVAWRVLGGIAAGAAILIAPEYIEEISPSNRRGSLVSLSRLMIVAGMAAAFFSNRLLLDVGENNWRWMLGVEAILASAYSLLLLAFAESPRWLPGRGRKEKDGEAPGKILGEREQETEWRRPGAGLAASPAGRGMGGRLGRKMRGLVLTGLALAFFQQIAGINAVLRYLPGLFIQAGASLDSAFWQSVATGLASLGMTLAALWLMNKIGRKPLLILGAAGMAAAALTCSWTFHTATYQLTAKSYEMLQAGRVPSDFMADLKGAEGPVFATDKEFVTDLAQRFGADRIAPYRDTLAAAGFNLRAKVVFWAIIAFAASFAFSLGPLTWVVLSEMFPGEHRGRALRLAGFWNAAAGAGVIFIFPWELSHLGAAGTFLACGLSALGALVFIAACIPGSRWKPLEGWEGVPARSPAETGAVPLTVK